MKKKHIIQHLTAAALAAFLAVTPAAAFSDTGGHWAEGAINKWSQEYSVIQGYEDGTFRPDDSITRGAFAGIMDRFLQFQAVSPGETFSDTAGTYWETAILKLHAAGVYLGNGGKALAGDTITRQQAVTMIARAFEDPGRQRRRPALRGRGSRWRSMPGARWRRCPPGAICRIPGTGISGLWTPSLGRSW